MHVVIIDDDPVCQAILRTRIEHEGLVPHIASDGIEGLRIIEDIKPQLCVVDWMLPGIDGPELVELMRRNKETCHIYTIMLTGKNRLEELVTAFESGVDDFIRKPLHVPEFTARLRAALRLISLQHELDLKVRQVNQLNEHLTEANLQLRSLATTDEMTGLPNRRSVLESLRKAWITWARYDTPLCLAMADIDHFKQINDRYGHAAGDQVIQHVGNLLLCCGRGTDLIGRYGGEEFILGMPGQSLDEAHAGMERLCELVRSEAVSVDGQGIAVTISIGVTAAVREMTSLEALIQAADQCLYAAKGAGRDRVAVTPAFMAGEAMRESA